MKDAGKKRVARIYQGNDRVTIRFVLRWEKLGKRVNWIRVLG